MEHFRNICESCSPLFDSEIGSGDKAEKKNGADEDEEDLLCDLGNNLKDSDK